MNRFSLVRFIICIAILLCSGTLCGHGQTYDLGKYRISMSEDKNGHVIRRSPSVEKTVLPSVYYDPTAELLLFSSETALTSLPVEVLDEAENVWMQETLNVEPEQVSSVSISSLPVGTYAVRIWIKGQAYIGEFEVE